MAVKSQLWFFFILEERRYDFPKKVWNENKGGRGWSGIATEYDSLWSAEKSGSHRKRIGGKCACRKLC